MQAIIKPKAIAILWGCFVFLSFAAARVHAEQFGLFTYKVVGDTVEITDYPQDETGHVDIPAEIDGKPVTAITGEGALATSDYEGAFQGCDISSVTIPNSVTNIGVLALGVCFNLGSVTIPDSVTTLADSSFYQSNGLTSVTIGSGVESIGALAFFHCYRITSLVIPDSVTSIDERAFALCRAMTSLSLGNGLTSIGPSAFADCTGLTSVDIPDSVTFIDNLAFHTCTSLTEVSVGSGITSLGPNTFSRCSRLESVVLGSNITSIRSGTFANCSSLSSITIPDGVTSISNSLFANCSSLSSITIPAGITTIENFAFSRCSSLSAAVFLGDAPATFGVSVFREPAPDFTVYFLNGSSGFTAPTWNDSASEMLNAPPTASETWLLGHSFPIGTDLDQDMNGDGVNLLMAYALNLDPNDNPSSELPAASLNAGALSMTYYAGREELTYTVQSSDNLQDWSSDEVTQSAPDLFGRRTASVGSDLSRRFVRLVVEN